MATRIWLSLWRQPRLPEVCRRCCGDRKVLAEQGARPGRSSSGVYRLVDSDPVLCVVPGGSRNGRMGFGRVRRVWCVGGVSGVEVGVESEGVIGIALQGPDAVVMRAAQCVADSVGQERVGADFHECRVVAAGRGYGLAKPHRVAQIGCPVIRVENDWAAFCLVICRGDYQTESGPIVFDANYWAANLRNPVRFSQAVAAAGRDYATFVEVSPHPLLTYAVSDTLGGAHHHSIGTLQRDTDDTLTFHTNLNATHTTHAPHTPHPPEPHPPIPTTPWHHTQHWIRINKPVDAAGTTPRPGTLLGEHLSVTTTPPAHLWQARLAPEAKPYPGRHRINGMELVPVSVLLQTLSTAAAESGAPILSDVRFEYPIVVDQPRVIQVIADD